MFAGNLFLGPRLRLTAPRPDDAFVWERWYHDSEFARLYDARPARPRTMQRIKQMMDEDDKRTDGFVFIMRLHSSDEMIGAIDLDSIHWNNGSAWLGIAIGDPVNRGLGYGSEAMHMVLRFAFDELNLHRVQLTVFAYNLHAIRLYERLGFVQEGVWREALHRDGQRWDVLHYALLRHEWRGSRG